jgi:hypothetical protein
VNAGKKIVNAGKKILVAGKKIVNAGRKKLNAEKKGEIEGNGFSNAGNRHANMKGGIGCTASF